MSAPRVMYMLNLLLTLDCAALQGPGDEPIWHKVQRLHNSNSATNALEAAAAASAPAAALDEH